ncbi:MAG TPA: glycosyltransferase family A protein [Candidatus Margulisiibacteriota bacterium]|nr:glycosyltransferase family A protein [Candidatus Margulisiibacteriota bacterium]
MASRSPENLSDSAIGNTPGEWPLDMTPPADPRQGNCRVSVVIPCYNHARYLGDAIQSVLHQTYRDFEIIVVDDGSTDDTPEVVARFGGAVRSLRQENRGLGPARNAGIIAANGDFVAFLDADDLWLPAYLAHMVQAFSNDATIGAIYCGWHYIDAGGKELARTNIRVFPRGQVYRAMTFMNFVIPSGVVVRRVCFDQLGLFDDAPCEDWDMWIRVLTRYAMVGVPQALVQYRIHENNMSANIAHMERAKRRVLAKHFGTDETRTAAHRRAYGGLHLSSAYAYFERGWQNEGRQALKRAFAVHPELVNELDTFYQLALTDQPVGSRGVFASLDLDACAGKLLEHLDAVFAAHSFSAEKRRQAQAYAHAHFALGLLAYGCGNLKRSRAHLLNALRRQPALLFRRQFLPTLMRTALGRALITHFRQWRGRVPSW